LENVRMWRSGRSDSRREAEEWEFSRREESKALKEEMKKRREQGADGLVED